MILGGMHLIYPDLDCRDVSNFLQFEIKIVELILDNNVLNYDRFL